MISILCKLFQNIKKIRLSNRVWSPGLIPMENRLLVSQCGGSITLKYVKMMKKTWKWCLRAAVRVPRFCHICLVWGYHQVCLSIHLLTVGTDRVLVRGTVNGAARNTWVVWLCFLPPEAYDPSNWMPSNGIKDEWTDWGRGTEWRIFPLL